MILTASEKTFEIITSLQKCRRTMESAYELNPLGMDKIPELLDVLKSLLPDSVVAYNWLLTLSRWTSTDKEMKLIILCPNGDCEDGSMVGLVENLAVPDRIFGTLYCQRQNIELMKEALLKTSLIEWSKLKHFSAVLSRFVPSMAEVYTAKGLTLKAVPCDLAIMQPEKAMNISIPSLLPNVRVRRLDESFLDVVCDNWPHYDFQYRPVVLKMLQLNHSVGVFVKTANDEEQLASMVLQGEYGGLGLLQTLTEHQRKGFAEIATASLTKTLGMEGIMPHGYILSENKIGKQLFEKIGFEVIGSVAKLVVVQRV
ncbi:uncharacterized protein LOC135939682 isoform X1 [Cloeon dipterum]|uniref:uncharacterized protein LOC135939682 isoform X1 n=1 Tax=Cloeon dipterum TaxID=197152 RepID=UPI0032203E4F